jgi:Kef-type K+ transport system membrane component KefB
MITTPDLTRAIVVLLVLLLAAHTGGALFQRLRQPRVVGEIIGGLVIGPTLLGQVWPGAVDWMFNDDQAVRSIIGFCQQFGLYLLMFCAGVDARRKMLRSERRIVGMVSFTGLLAPFILGALAVLVINTDALEGDHATRTSFLLVFATSIAVTSIPVISRIFHDLGLLRTGFARVVLGVAVVEDVILYVVLAIAVSLATPSGPATGLPGSLGLQAGSAGDILYHSITTVALLGLLFAVAPRANRWIGAHPGVKGPLSNTARRLIVLMVCVVGFLLLDLEAFLGAFAAGLFVGTPRPSKKADAQDAALPSLAQDSISRFAFAFFIPCYFALVGVNLNLAHGFMVLPFLAFLIGACLVKALSTYAGGRLAGLPHRPTVHLSIALNARGGPGIVLATVASAAGIVNSEFYIWLVLLAILTSIAAGSHLQRVPAEKLSLRLDDSEPSDDNRTAATPGEAVA